MMELRWSGPADRERERERERERRKESSKFHPIINK
jgi:hypothetical protein